MTSSDAMLPIGTVERETGLSKDVLRVWERRYGFPNPERNPNGDRVYPAAQVRRLRLLRRLMDAGKRPGRIVPLPEAELLKLLDDGTETETSGRQPDELIALLREGDPAAVEHHLQQLLATQGLRSFVTETLPDMNEWVGDAWMHGSISVFEEHFYSEQVQNLLRQALQNLPARGTARPRIVLTTLPGEQHSLGLLMAQTLLCLADADARSFGIQMPLTDIATAAQRQQADIIALSFSSAFPAGVAMESLTSLRELVPADIEIWVGGGGLRPLRQLPEGVDRVEPLEALIQRTRDWRDKSL